LTILDCTDPGSREPLIRRAAAAVRRGALVVMPTDTVYGLGVDAFAADAVGRLLAAKGRSRQMPVPVLVGATRTLDGLATGIGAEAKALIEAFWPGALTLIVRQQPSLAWDLGETGGTVAVRMPLHPVALELLRLTGPMAVSSANRTGEPPATSAAAAHSSLGDTVELYLDAGAVVDNVPSTIVDVTGPTPKVVRAGAIDANVLTEVVPTIGGQAAEGP
jgi:tRNA threonylcarbamoyl adenosine modification protein (Sua5/YciO/YrdC/YwlC family)